MLVDAVDEKIGGYLVTWLIDSNPHMKYLINAPKQLPGVYFFYSFGSPVQGIVWYWQDGISWWSWGRMVVSYECRLIVVDVG